MTKRVNRLFALVVFSLAASIGAADDAIDVMCVYYPHWHEYPKGNEWFHKGFTEWEFVETAKPRVPGQKIPFRPLYGYLDGKNPADVAKEIDLASNAGIDVFLFDWYWYGGAMVDAILGSALRPLLDRGVAVVAVGYRYLRDVEQDGGVKPPVQGCIADCEAAVRFVKEHAGDYGIDVSRLTISGGSAGTCSPLDLLSAGNRQALVRHGHVQF